MTRDTAQAPPSDSRHGGGRNRLLLTALAVAVFSRMGLWLAGLLAFHLLPSGAAMQRGNLFWHQPVRAELEIWSRWDSEWYLLIAEKGYDASEELRTLGHPWGPTATAGFLPLYPVLIRLLAPVTGPVAAGVLISHLAFFAAVVLLFRFAAAESGREDGAVAGLVAVAALAAFPTSLFLTAVYAESLFLALSLGTVHLARQQRMLAAGVLGGLATLTRPFGILLTIPMLMEWWRHRRADPPAPVSFAPVLLIPGAFLSFLLYCQRTLGDPFAYFAQKSWRGGFGGPWTAFVRWWEAGPTIHGAHGSTVELVFAVAALAGLVAMARVLSPSLTAYSAACVAAALGSSLWSFGRLVLVVFPFFILAGVLWERGTRWPALLLVGAGGPLSGLFMALFANWWWAG